MATSAAYATEWLTDGLWDELAPLMAGHWAEVADYRDLALSVSRDAYQRVQLNGALRVFTARTEPPSKDRGRLVGYLSVFVAPAMHTGQVCANQDALYVLPDFRGSRIGVGLIAYAHEALREEGVVVLRQHSKADRERDIGPMLEHTLGYRLTEKVYAIRLDHDRDC